MMVKYDVYLKTKDGKIGQYVQDIASISMVIKYNEFSQWTIKTVSKDPCPFERGTGVLIIRDGKPILVGEATLIEQEYDGRDKLFSWAVTGNSELTLLSRRIIYPDPTTDNLNVAYSYTATGQLSVVIQDMIEYNLGEQALSARVDPRIVRGNTDRPIGDVVTVQTRFGNLWDVIKKFIDAYGYGIKEVYNINTGKTSFDLYQTSDRSDKVLFSTSWMTILQWTRTEKEPEGNFIISACQGTGTERDIAVASSAESIGLWGRIEYFNDARSETSAATNAAAKLDQLNTYQSGYTVTLSTAENAPQFGIDWELGDIISIEINGEIRAGKITQIGINVDKRTETISPSIDVYQRGDLYKIFREMSELRETVQQLLGQDS